MQKKKDKKQIIVLVSLIFLIMAISPVFNKLIYAVSYNGDFTRLYARNQITGVQPGKNVSEETKRYATIRNELFKFFSEGENRKILESQANNVLYKETNDSTQPDQKIDPNKNAFNPDDIASKYMVNEGKLYDPRGMEKIDNAKIVGYNEKDLFADAGVFCIERNVLLPATIGNSKESLIHAIQDSYGYTDMNAEDVANRIMLSAKDATQGDRNDKEFTLGSYGTYGTEADIKNKLEEMGIKEPEYSHKEEVTVVEQKGKPVYYIEKNGNKTPKLVQNELGQWVELIGTEDRVYIEEITVEDSAEVKKQKKKEYADAVKEGVKRIKEEFEAGGSITPKIHNDAMDRFPEDRSLDNAGMQSEARTYITGNTEMAFTPENFALMFYVSSFAQRKQNESKYQIPDHYIGETSKNAENGIQAAIWMDPDLDKIGNGLHIASVVSYGKNTYSAGQDFKRYWYKMLEFQNSHPSIERKRQKFFGPPIRPFIVVNKNDELPEPTKQPRTIKITNPEIKYEPRVLGPDGTDADEDLEKATKVHFDATRQKWLVGPFKLDYIMDGTKYNTETNKKDAKYSYFSALTDVSLKGIYSDGSTNYKVKYEDAFEHAGLPQDSKKAKDYEELEKLKREYEVAQKRADILFGYKVVDGFIEPANDSYDKKSRFAYAKRNLIEAKEEFEEALKAKDKVTNAETDCLNLLIQSIEAFNIQEQALKTGIFAGSLLSDEYEYEIKNYNPSEMLRLCKMYDKISYYTKQKLYELGYGKIGGKYGDNTRSFLPEQPDPNGKIRVRHSDGTEEITTLKPQGGKQRIRLMNQIWGGGDFDLENVYIMDEVYYQPKIRYLKKLQEFKGEHLYKQKEFSNYTKEDKEYREYILALNTFLSNYQNSIANNYWAVNVQLDFGPVTYQPTNKAKSDLKNEGQNVRVTRENEKNISDKELGLQDVKGWRLKIGREKNGLVNGNQKIADYPGMEGLPAPNEPFYFEIDYDPALKQISKARFTFHYMKANGYRRTYDSKAIIKNNVTITRKLDFLDPESIMNGLDPARGITTRIEVKSDDHEHTTQRLISVVSIRWLEKCELELYFEPPENKKYPMFNLVFPIGGRVWRDNPDDTKKHVGFDYINPKGSKQDEPKKDIPVHVFRNFVKIDKDGLPIEILNRQYARLYDPESNEEVDGIHKIFTKEDGSWGPYDIHDIGFNKDEINKMGGKIDSKNYAITFDVRYDYDGLMYEPVLPFQKKDDNQTSMTTEEVKNRIKGLVGTNAPEKGLYNDSSWAFENALVRERFNNVNATMTGKDPMKEDGNTTGRTKPSVTPDDQPIDKMVNMDGRDIYYEMDKDTVQEPSNVAKVRRVNSRYKEVNPKDFYKDGKASDEILDHLMNATLLDLHVRIPAKERILNDETKVSKVIPAKFGDAKGTYYAVNEYMLNLNLGIKKRQPVNLGITKDLQNALVTVNKKAYNYIYSDLYTDYLTQEEKKAGEGTSIDIPLAKERDEKKIQQALDIYKTDYIYRTTMYNSNEDLFKALNKEVEEEKQKDKLDAPRANRDGVPNGDHDDTRQLDVFITYKMRMYNDSSMDAVLVSGIDDYHSNKMQLVDKEIKKSIEIDPKASVEKKADKEKKTNVDLERKDIQIPMPRYKKIGNISGNSADIVNEKEVPEINGKDVKALQSYNIEPNGNYHFKSSMQIPESLEAERHRGERAKEDIVLNPYEVVDIYTTYRVKNLTELIDRPEKEKESLGELKDNPSLIRLSDSLRLGELANICEITEFTSYDCLTGKVSAKYDVNSAPDNVDLKDIDNENTILTFEDDTDNAPTINLRIPKEEPKERTLEGIVWEDKRTVNNRGITTGDGIFKKDDEKGIAKMPLTLEERVSLRKSNEMVLNNPNLTFKPGEETTEVGHIAYIDVPFIWPNDIRQNNIEIDLKGLTKFESNIETGEDGSYKYEGIPAGNFAVRMDYTSPNKESRTAIFNDGRAQGINSVAVMHKLKESGFTQDIKPEDLIQTVNYEEDKRDIKYYNGADFKSTMFYSTGGTPTGAEGEARPKEEGDIDNLNKTWISKDKDKLPINSYLRDDEIRRIEVTDNFDTFKNANVQLLDIFRRKPSMIMADTEDPSQNSLAGAKANEEEKLKIAHKMSTMRATTPKLNYSVEYYEKFGDDAKNKEGNSIMSEYKDLYAVDGNYKEVNKPEVKLDYGIKNINMGIVERPKTKLVMQKEIENIKLTTTDGDVKIDAKYNVKANVEFDKSNERKNVYGETIEPETKITLSRELDETHSTGSDYLLSLDRSTHPNGVIGESYEDKKAMADGTFDEKPRTGFRYINIDEALMQDSTVNITYGIYAFNAGEKDLEFKIRDENGRLLPELATEELRNKLQESTYREGPDMGLGILNHTAYPDEFGIGKYIGRAYYTISDNDATEGNIAGAQGEKQHGKEIPTEEIAKSEVREIIDLVDNSAIVNVAEEKNKDWIPADKKDLIGIVQNVNEKNYDKAEYTDINGTDYITDLNKITTVGANNIPAHSKETLGKVKRANAPEGKEKDANIKTNVYLIKEYSKKLVPIAYMSNNYEPLELDLTELSKDPENAEIAKYIKKWQIEVQRTISSQANKDDLGFENIIELAGYHNGNGSRDNDTPGNLTPQLDKAYENGGGVFPGHETTEHSESDKEVEDPNDPITSGQIPPQERTYAVATREHDSGSTELVTLSPPTGLGQKDKARKQALIITIITGAMVVTILTQGISGNSKKPRRNKQ